MDIIKVSEHVPRRGAIEHRYSLTGKNTGIALGVLDFLLTS